MQYYVKFFNLNTSEFVGFYKETGKSCVSKMKNGMKYFTDYQKALEVANELNGGFLRDKDGHYYTAYTIVCGDSQKQPPKEEYKSKQEKEEELKDELETLIRKSRSRNAK